MSDAILYHNPRCSKSRQALAYLQEQASNVNLTVIEYLKQAPSIHELNILFDALDIESAQKMIRPNEAEFALAGLTKTSSNEDILKAITNHPKLLERPILLIGNKAAIGRPLENIEALVNG